MDMAERIEANANLVLWCVHVLGPDDVYAEPSHASAVAKAAKLNSDIWSNAKSPDDILCFAFADMWPWSAEAHAQAIKDETAETAERDAVRTNLAATPLT
jgi:hypothetical protein